MSFTDFGKFYGYPDCCIKDFTYRFKNNFIKPTENQIKVSNKTGFIPCQLCCLKIEKKELNLEELINNRECDIKFPHAH